MHTSWDIRYYSFPKIFTVDVCDIHLTVCFLSYRYDWYSWFSRNFIFWISGMSWVTNVGAGTLCHDKTELKVGIVGICQVVICHHICLVQLLPMELDRCGNGCMFTEHLVTTPSPVIAKCTGLTNIFRRDMLFYTSYMHREQKHKNIEVIQKFYFQIKQNTFDISAKLNYNICTIQMLMRYKLGHQ